MQVLFNSIQLNPKISQTTNRTHDQGWRFRFRMLTIWRAVSLWIRIHAMMLLWRFMEYLRWFYNV